MAEPIHGQRWDLTANEIAAKTDELMKSTQEIYDAIANVKLEDANFNNVIKPIADSDSVFEGIR